MRPKLSIKSCIDTNKYTNISHPLFKNNFFVTVVALKQPIQ